MVNFKVNAIDNQSFQGALAQNERLITGIVRKGFARRGARIDIPGTPFRWGQSDCVCVVTQWIDRVHRLKLSDLAIGHYHDKIGAYMWQRDHDPMAALKAAGFDEWAPAPARSGDVLIGRSGEFVSMGFVWGGAIWSSCEKRGVFSVPLSKISLIECGWVICRRPHQ